MSSRSELLFEEMFLHCKAEAAITVSHHVVMSGTDSDDVQPATAAKSTWPKGIARALQATLDGDVEVVPFIPGQRKLVVDDGTISGAGVRVCCSALVAGRAGISTPTAGDVVWARSLEAGPGAGKLCLVELCSPYEYAAT